MRNRNLILIHQQMIDYVMNSAVIVETDTAHSTVSIKDASGAEIFLQGDEADTFNDEVARLYNDAGDITESDAARLTAYPYVDLLTEQ